MNINNNLLCCGTREISRLGSHNNAKEAMQSFINAIDPDQYNGGNKFRYAIFSSAGRRSTYGSRFAAYIMEYGLGKVIDTGYNKNPNTGHLLRVWVWTVDHEALAKWAKGPLKRSHVSRANNG